MALKAKSKKSAAGKNSRQASSKTKAGAQRKSAPTKAAAKPAKPKVEKRGAQAASAATPPDWAKATRYLGR